MCTCHQIDWEEEMCVYSVESSQAMRGCRDYKRKPGLYLEVNQQQNSSFSYTRQIDHRPILSSSVT